MAVRYDFYENPPKQGKPEKPQLHARIVASSTVDIKQLSKEIHSRCSLTESDVRATLIALEELIKEHLQNGDRIYLNGLGRFEMTLKCPEITSTREIRAESISFKSVVFRPEKKLKKELSTTEFERVEHKKHSQKYTDDQIEHMLKDYLRENRYISGNSFQALCRQTSSTANRILKKMVKEEKLIRSGIHRFPIYEPGKKLSDTTI